MKTPRAPFYSGSKPRRGFFGNLLRIALSSDKRKPPLKVSFLIAGTQKGGTSALHSYLRAHPQVCMPRRKEVHFFDKDRFFANGTPDYSTYHARFNPSSPNQLLGEATPIYMYWEPAPGRIRDYNPEMKFIISLRNPILRAFSNWNMERSRGNEPLSFWDALQMEAPRRASGARRELRLHSYIARGFYAAQLRHLWSYFPKSQTHVLRQDQLYKDPLDVLNDVCAFLDINPFKAVREQIVFSEPYVTSISHREWRHLAELFEPDIRALEIALNWECSDWLREPRFGD
jgi:hypothetical protein